VLLSFVDPSLVRKHLGAQVVDPSAVVALLEYRAIPAGTPVFLDEVTMLPPPRPAMRRPSWPRRSTSSRPTSATTRGSLTSSRMPTSRTGNHTPTPRGAPEKRVPLFRWQHRRRVDPSRQDQDR
jgi:hypothetical protein